MSTKLYTFGDTIKWVLERIIHASLSIANLGRTDYSLKTIVKFKQTSWRKFACVQLASNAYR